MVRSTVPTIHGRTITLRLLAELGRAIGTHGTVELLSGVIKTLVSLSIVVVRNIIDVHGLGILVGHWATSSVRHAAGLSAYWWWRVGTARRTTRNRRRVWFRYQARAWHNSRGEGRRVVNGLWSFIFLLWSVHLKLLLVLDLLGLLPVSQSVVIQRLLV